MRVTETERRARSIAIDLLCIPLAPVMREHQATPAVRSSQSQYQGSEPFSWIDEDYYDGFKALDLGSSAAQSVVLMVIVIALTVVQFRYIERKIQY
jgi:hypothetical protein